MQKRCLSKPRYLLPHPSNKITLADGKPVEIVDICEKSIGVTYFKNPYNLKDAMDFEKRFISETCRSASSADTLLMTSFAEHRSVLRRSRRPTTWHRKNINNFFLYSDFHKHLSLTVTSLFCTLRCFPISLLPIATERFKQRQYMRG
ncbi:hypothetical protein FGIG_02615 [Fasciola gigantica]|uniref:Uncharacterized protein n=1 Tax=Fasciola gigantica TaxID=46835 RepID=A0A504YF07_FASGI|nr:hypothetical protein FGIG_02615 [Fasciola gigantica]